MRPRSAILLAVTGVVLNAFSPATCAGQVAVRFFAGAHLGTYEGRDGFVIPAGPSSVTIREKGRSRPSIGAAVDVGLGSRVRLEFQLVESDRLVQVIDSINSGQVVLNRSEVGRVFNLSTRALVAVLGESLLLGGGGGVVYRGGKGYDAIDGTLAPAATLSAQSRFRLGSLRMAAGADGFFYSLRLHQAGVDTPKGFQADLHLWLGVTVLTH